MVACHALHETQVAERLRLALPAADLGEHRVRAGKVGRGRDVVVGQVLHHAEPVAGLRRTEPVAGLGAQRQHGGQVGGGVGVVAGRALHRADRLDRVGRAGEVAEVREQLVRTHQVGHRRRVVLHQPLHATAVAPGDGETEVVADPFRCPAGDRVDRERVVPVTLLREVGVQRGGEVDRVPRSVVAAGVLDAAAQVEPFRREPALCVGRAGEDRGVRRRVAAGVEHPVVMGEQAGGRGGDVDVVVQHPLDHGVAVLVPLRVEPGLREVPDEVVQPEPARRRLLDEVVDVERLQSALGVLDRLARRRAAERDRGVQVEVDAGVAGEPAEQALHVR